MNNHLKHSTLIIIFLFLITSCSSGTKIYSTKKNRTSNSRTLEEVNVTPKAKSAKKLDEKENIETSADSSSEEAYIPTSSSRNENYQRNDESNGLNGGDTKIEQDLNDEISRVPSDEIINKDKNGKFSPENSEVVIENTSQKESSESPQNNDSTSVLQANSSEQANSTEQVSSSEQANSAEQVSSSEQGSDHTAGSTKEKGNRKSIEEKDAGKPSQKVNQNTRRWNIQRVRKTKIEKNN